MKCHLNQQRNVRGSVVRDPQVVALLRCFNKISFVCFESPLLQPTTGHLFCRFFELSMRAVILLATCVLAQRAHVLVPIIAITDESTVISVRGPRCKIAHSQSPVL
jgi:hypothetical protein